jgi:glucuronate isomerase
MHGHLDACLFLDDEPLGDPVSVLVSPDHYVTRMLHSQGVPLDSLGAAGTPVGSRATWRVLCERWNVLKGTASHIWLSQELEELFGVEEEPTAKNADELYDQISESLLGPSARPRALYDRFGIEVLATTDSALADLSAHDRLANDPSFAGTVIPTFRPDEILDASRPTWIDDVECLGEIARMPVGSLEGLLGALETRRGDFVARGAVSTDHGHDNADSLTLDTEEANGIYSRLMRRAAEPDDATRFRAHMLTEMARMSCSDRLVMQLHPGVHRNHDTVSARRFGPDIGADFPDATPLVRPLQPLLSKYGSDPGFTVVVYTVDETTLGRELAPMASYYPALRIGSPWWFLDAPDAMSRCWRAAVESAGFFNFAGFVDDSRSLCSVGARHDVARRVVCSELARLVVTHRLDIESARDVAVDYCYEAPKRTFSRRPSRFGSGGGALEVSQAR